MDSNPTAQTPVSPVAAQPTTPADSQPAPQDGSSKKGILSLILKIVLFLLGAGALIGVGYYLGSNFSGASSSKSATPTAYEVIEESPTPSEAQVIKTVTAGLSDKSTAFGQYTIDILEGWTDEISATPAGTNTLNVTKNSYKITISQLASEGMECTYEAQAPTGMATNFSNFQDVNAALRRSWNIEATPSVKLTYTVCQKNTEGSYGTPTSFGWISIESPSSSDEKTLKEIDKMLSSLKSK